MRSPPGTIATLILATGLSACGGEPEGGAPASAGGAVPTAAREPDSYPENGPLTPLSNSFTWFRWSKGEATKIMQPFATHVCGITMVRGQLARDTALHIFQLGANWAMRGDLPGSNFLQMDAVCEPLSVFTVDPGVTRANLGVSSATVTAANSTATRALAANTAPIFLGLQGSFDGGGEKASVDLDGPSISVRKGTATGPHVAFANALFLGPKRPFYVHDDPFVPDPSIDLPESGGPVACFGVDCDGRIAPLATNFCYLTSVSGDFNGADEWVQVFPNASTGLWTFKGARGTNVIGDSGSVFAQAQCLKLDQRHPVIIIR